MLQNFISGSWQTQSAGILMIIGAVVHLCFIVHAGNVSESAIMQTAVAVLGGIGLLRARQNTKTSEQVGAGDKK